MKYSKITFTLLAFSILFFANCGSSSSDDKPEKPIDASKLVWMKINLDVDAFRNGDKIKEAKTNEDWRIAKENQTPAWCYYDFNSKNAIKYGKLYNWYAVKDIRGLAPKGWHIPSNKEIEAYNKFLSNDAGLKMKSSKGWHLYEDEDDCRNCEDWTSSEKAIRNCRTCRNSRRVIYYFDGNGNNKSTFNGLPSGTKNTFDEFEQITKEGHWWCANEYEEDSDYAWFFSLKDLSNDVEIFSAYKEYGKSVRCLKDY